MINFPRYLAANKTGDEETVAVAQWSDEHVVLCAQIDALGAEWFDGHGGLA